jgi:hypothetical protein
MTQYCNDYGDRIGCLGTPDDRYTMNFDDIGERPILWCAFCGPAAHALDQVLTKALEERGPAFVEDFAREVDTAHKDLYRT